MLGCKGLKEKYQKNSQIGYIFLFVVMLILFPLV